MTGSRPAIALVIGLFVLLLAGAARAQEDFAAGKTPEQLFRQNCSACHRSPQGLARAGEKAGGLLFGLENFLAQHYTASGRSAQLIAAYLKAVDSAAPPRRSRRPHRRTSTPKKPDAAKTDSTKQSGKPPTDKPKVDKPKADKPVTTESKPDKKKPAPQSSQAKREKPKAAE